MISQNANGPCVGCGPGLNWRNIKFHEPVENWTGLRPEDRLVAQVKEQIEGRFPPDE